MTDDGIKNKRHAGDFFGEGALLHPLKIRSATIKCKTPVHVIEISREYFEKYMASSTGLGLALREKDKIRCDRLCYMSTTMDVIVIILVLLSPSQFEVFDSPTNNNLLCVRASSSPVEKN